MLDALVIGGGLSGLRAAELLLAGGAEVELVEARERVGGRLESVQVGAGTFDVGGQWMGPGQPRLAALAHRLGVATFRTYHRGRGVFHVGGRVHRSAAEIPWFGVTETARMGVVLGMVDLARRGVDARSPWTARRALHRDSVTVGEWADETIRPARVRGTFDAAVRVVFGAEPSELSLLYFLSYLNAGGGLLNLTGVERGAQQLRFVGGAGGLAKAYAESLRCRIRYGKEVVRIDQHKPDRVRVRLAGGKKLKARYAVVALPTNMLSHIEFRPVLSPMKARLIEGVEMGHTVKVLVTYRHAFWRDAGLSGELVSDRPPLSVVFDNCDRGGVQPALVGFIVGQAAGEFMAQSPQKRREVVLQQLSRAFGPAALSCSEYVERDWKAERFSGGCPAANPKPGVLTAAGPALREAQAPRRRRAGPVTWKARCWPGSARPAKCWRVSARGA